ncbi:hypothetical protein WA026_013563 [Henosepilachna vigintioctopunctata]|uniref:RBR-type E3 ubiquitin transferase n=1 Tax=Henosepilachna vigintioctopunctata TaxID=420089 RepID=A0AAW1V6C2_9CUCU
MDSEKQKDEVTALESIYTDEEFSYFKEGNVHKITVKIFPILPQNFCLTYKHCNGTTLEEKKIFISNLPPVILSIILPLDYPSVSPPIYTLRSSWLRYQAMLKLCNELNRLWNMNKGQEILFTWMNFLQNDLLEFLNIKDTIDIDQALAYYRISKSNFERDSQICTTNNSLNCNSNNNHNVAGSSKEPQKKMIRNMRRTRHKALDTRVICDIIGNKNPLQMLIDYNEMKSQAQFMKDLFKCNICFADKLGQYCTKFIPCSHVFCKECTANYVRTKIGDGSVQNILCPEEKCESELHLSQVKELLLPEEFYKFDSMLLSSTLDMMTDIIYCPRRNCQYPVSKEEDEKMATCPMCRYVFCIYCKMVYHGIEPCKMKIVVKDASVEEIEELKRRYGEKQVQLMIENSRSEDWIYSHSQMCPKCYTAIEKADGCNKMTCWKCGTYFCWNCLQKLDKNDPYMHFRNPSSRCFEKLWPREYEDEGDVDNEAIGEQDLANNYFRLFYV